MRGFWNRVARHLGRGADVFVARVVEHTAHSPGTTGAGLIVTSENAVAGTIGGGVMELNVIEVARKALVNPNFAPQIRTLVHRRDPDGEPSGLICAGRQTNLYMVCRKETEGEAIRRAATAERDDVPGVLEVNPQGVRYRADDGEDHPEHSRLHRFHDGWRYVEQMLNLRRAAVVGGGHCGLALSRTLHHLGYFVSAFDDRPGLATMQDNVFADRKITVEDLAEVGALITYPGLTQAVVMTTNLDSDVRALVGLLEREFPFVGVMGSPAKLAAIRKVLQAEGIDESLIGSIVAPVGLPIGSDTPEEIAVSVAAQLVEVRKSDTVPSPSSPT